MLFLSHANPEDNEFASWLALKLANEGYAVWCDLTKLLGGEDFWKDAEQALRERTVKLLYILSRTSNAKTGPLQELRVASNVARREQLQDFVIPLKIDDLPHGETNIELARLNAMEFSASWAAGLSQLLSKLKKDRVPKDRRFSPASVASWWRENSKAARAIKSTPEICFLNWFQIRSIPEDLYIYSASAASEPATSDLGANLLCRVGELYLTFAKKSEVGDLLGEPIRVSTEALLAQDVKGVPLSAKDARIGVRRLLRMAWEKTVADRQFPSYQLSQNALCFFVTKDTPNVERFTFQGVDGKEAWRSLFGTRAHWISAAQKTVPVYWHFGIHAIPFLYPHRALALKSHVLFSDDGLTIWDSPARLHRARRTYCKDWWNAHWRDRMIAMVTCIAGRAESIHLPLSSSTFAAIATRPLEVTTPVALDDEVIAAKDPEESKGEETGPEEEFDDEVDGEEEDLATEGLAKPPGE